MIPVVIVLILLVALVVTDTDERGGPSGSDREP